MLGPITTPAPRDPAAVRAAILDHIAAIDALLNGVAWSSVDAENIAQDVGEHLTDAQDALEAAVYSEAEWHRERGT